MAVYPYAAEERQADAFNGLAVYRVTPDDGFDLLGRIPAGTDTDQFYSGWLRGVFNPPFVIPNL
ncbi:MAG: hypothetical protein ACOZF0_14125 [Thermodesulfobacteriota bacterium]